MLTIHKLREVAYLREKRHSGYAYERLANRIPAQRPFGLTTRGFKTNNCQWGREYTKCSGTLRVASIWWTDGSVG